jgi:hypothetical protein
MIFNRQILTDNKTQFCYCNPQQNRPSKVVGHGGNQISLLAFARNRDP